jgi:multiple sugar transport system permease protein
VTRVPFKDYLDPHTIRFASNRPPLRRALWQVMLPLTRPGLASYFVYLLLVSWSEFVFGRTLMTSPGHRVLTVGLQSFSSEYQVDWPGLMAAGTLTLVPIVVLFVLLEPFLVSGMTKGALAN